MKNWYNYTIKYNNNIEGQYPALKLSIFQRGNCKKPPIKLRGKPVGTAPTSKDKGKKGKGKGYGKGGKFGKGSGKGKKGGKKFRGYNNSDKNWNKRYFINLIFK